MVRAARLASSVSIAALLSSPAFAHVLLNDAAHPNFTLSQQQIAQSPAAKDKNRQRVFNIILKPEAGAAAATAIQSYFQKFGFQTEYDDYTNSVELRGSYTQAEQAGGFSYVAGGAKAAYRLSAQPHFPADFAGAILATTFDPGPVMQPQIALTLNAPSTLPVYNNVVGLGPADYATLYGYNNAYAAGINGKGQTVDIAACFGYLHGDKAGQNDDITIYSQIFGVSPKPNITAMYPSGHGSHSFSGEPLLDLSRVYGTAPGTAIRIWFAPSCQMAEFTNLFLDIAKDQKKHPAAAMSVSYGLPEVLLYEFYGSSFFTGMNAALTKVTNGAVQKVALFASSGDNGDESIFEPFFIGDLTVGASDVLYPASDPNVLAVGGTTVFPVSQSSVTRQEEWAWSGAAFSNITGSGGGISNIWPIPSWQKCAGAIGACGPQASAKFKNVPDISSNASLESTVLMVEEGALVQTGGTSASSPTMAGTVALMRQAGLNSKNWPAFFYANYAQWVTPISGGGNGRYVAQPPTSDNPSGYSNVTGLGVPCFLHFPNPCSNGQ